MILICDKPYYYLYLLVYKNKLITKKCSITACVWLKPHQGNWAKEDRSRFGLTSWTGYVIKGCSCSTYCKHRQTYKQVRAAETNTPWTNNEISTADCTSCKRNSGVQNGSNSVIVEGHPEIFGFVYQIISVKACLRAIWRPIMRNIFIKMNWSKLFEAFRGVNLNVLIKSSWTHSPLKIGKSQGYEAPSCS